MNLRNGPVYEDREADYEYENPPIAETIQEQVNNALNYHLDRRWPQELSAQKAGIDRSKLNRAISNVQKGRAPYTGVGGRPKLVSHKGIEELGETLTENAVNMVSTQPHEFNKLVKDKIAEESKNGYGMGNAQQVSERTLKRILEDVKARKHRGKVKTPARTAAHDDIRGALSLCGVLHTVMEQVSPDLFVSTDEVSILVNSNDEPVTVLTTKEADDILKATNTSASITEAERKQRVVKFSLSISAGFDCVVKIVKFPDRCFENKMKDNKPMILDAGEGLFFCFYAYGLPSTIVEEAIHRKCILPTVLKLREKLQQEQQMGMTSAIVKTQSSTSQEDSQQYKCGSSSADCLKVAGIDITHSQSESIGHEYSQQSEQVVTDEAVNIHENFYEWICLACDGAYGQIDAILSNINEYSNKKNLRIILMKYSAGRSMSESPNDLGWMHSILHGAYKSYKFKYNDFKDPPGGIWKEMKQYLQETLESSSFTTIWRCFCHVREYLDKAFSKANIRSSFTTAGIEPLDNVTIMSHNPYFRQLNRDDAQWVINTAIPKVAQVVAEKGYIPEADFDTILAERPGVDNSKPRKGMPLNNMVVNRQRALILNHPAFIKEVAEKAAVKEQAKATRAASKQQKQLRDTSVQQQIHSVPASSSSISTQPHATVLVSSSSEQHPAKKARVTACCSNPLCTNIQDGDGFGWIKCSWPYCRTIYCFTSDCHALAIEHHQSCTRRK